MAGGRTKKTIDPKRLKELASKGLKLEHIAECLGMSYDTLNERCKENPQLREIISSAKAQLAEKVVSRLYETAFDWNHPKHVTALIYLANYLGYAERPLKVELTTDLSDQDLITKVLQIKAKMAGDSS